MRDDEVSAVQLEGIPKKVKGRRGKRIRLISNYVKVRVEDKEGIFQYKLTFWPPIDNLEVRKRFLDQFQDVLVTEQRLYDGVSLFLPFRLPGRVHYWRVDPHDEATTLDGTGTLGVEPKNKFRVRTTLSEQTVLTGRHPSSPDTFVTAVIEYVQKKPYRELVPFFNILIRRLMTALGKTELKRHKEYYDPDVKFNLPQFKLQIWPGICTSVEEQEDGLMLCLDTSYQVFRTDTVYDYIFALNDKPDWKREFNNYIVGKIISTRYNHFTYRIDDVDWGNSPLSTFDRKGEQISYTDYYKTAYGIPIKDANQPLLISRIKVKQGYRASNDIIMVSLVPELCYVCGMEQKLRDDKKVMKEVSRFTFCSPTQKLAALKTFVSRVNELPETRHILDDWNIKIESNLLEIEGRELPSPALRFRDKDYHHDIYNGTFQLDGASGIHEAVDLKRWLVLCPERDAEKVKEFGEMYKLVCKSLGIEMLSSAEIVTVDGQSPQDFREALEDYANPTRFQIVLVVMPHPKKETYSVIKTVCCSQIGIPSQVVSMKTLLCGAGLEDVTKKIAVQINCKLGGSPWGLCTPMDEQVMLVGVDVYHDIRRISPSVVALVASMNNACTKYFSKSYNQAIHQEVTDNMQPLFSEALEAYFLGNGRMPDRIIVFRDGGSLSMVPVMLEHEVKPQLTAIKMFCPGLKNYSYVMVSKRIPQRLYTKNHEGASNPPVGTVVDQTITYPDMFDFYITGRPSSHGVAKPTHYMVIYNKGTTPADLLQEISHSSTFMYFNFCGAIKVPAVIQYAHKLAAMVGKNLRNAPVGTLDNYLFYL